MSKKGKPILSGLTDVEMLEMHLRLNDEKIAQLRGIASRYEDEDVNKIADSLEMGQEAVRNALVRFGVTDQDGETSTAEFVHDLTLGMTLTELDTWAQRLYDLARDTDAERVDATWEMWQKARTNHQTALELRGSH